MARQEQKQNTAGNQVKKTVRVPLIGNLQQRSTNLPTRDQRYVNCLIETSTNPITESKKLFVVKRPGTTIYSTPATDGDEGRGIWYFNGYVYSIFGDTLYRNNTAVQTLSTDTGICGAVEFPNGSDYGNSALFLSDGIDSWVIKKNNAITKVDQYHLQWSARTPIEAGDRRVPTTHNGFWYFALDNGNTHSTTEPTWPLVVGNTVVDNALTWECGGTYTELPVFQTSTFFGVGDVCMPTTETGYWYACVDGGTTAGTEPSWPITVGETVASGGTIWEVAGEYGGFPTPHMTTPQFMDQYIFLPDGNSNDIYNSNITKPFSWSALSFASAEAYPDNLIGLARQNNYIVAFGEKSTEFMYNEAKVNALTDFDSPISRAESLVLQVGALTKDCIFQSEKTIMFIGRSDIGGHSVWRIDGTQPREISTEYIEKFIDLETPSSGVTGFGMRVAGHVLYIINLPTSDKTFVYDIEEQVWTEWEYNGGRLPFMYMTDKNGDVLVQHESNGSIYKFDAEVFKDFDADIEVTIQLAKQDFDTDNRKFFHQIVLIGDSLSGTPSLSWSDDDYVTWETDRILSTGTRPYYTRTGAARRRAWRIKHTANYRFRLEALEITYSIGHH